MRTAVFSFAFACVLLSPIALPASTLHVNTGQHQIAATSKVQPTALASGTPIEICRLDLWSCQDPKPPGKISCLYGSQSSGGCAPPTASVPTCAATATSAELTPDYHHSPPDARSIAQALGNPGPFTLTALDANTLVISRSGNSAATARKTKNSASGSSDVSNPDASILDWLRILVAAGSTVSFDLEIPHAASLGDAANRINELQSPLFSAQAVGRNKVRIAATRTPSCEDLQVFLASVRKLAWSVQSESPVARVYALDAPTAANLLNSATASSGAAASKSSSAPAATDTSAATPDASDSDTAPTDAGNSKAASNKTGSTDDADTPVADAKADAKDAGAGAKDKAQSSDGNQPSGSQPSTAAGDDLIVFSASANPGDDSQITEQKRILALLDLPRPEMIINGWVVQNSTKRADKFGAANQLIRQTVNDHNNGLQQTILTGWKYIKAAMSQPEYFEPSFRDYLTAMVVLDNADYSDPLAAAQPAAALQRRIASAEKIKVEGVPSQNVCPVGQYCLGYANLFQPLQPRLTSLLLAIIAAKDPVLILNCAVNRIEDVPDASGRNCGAATSETESQVWAQSTHAELQMRRADLRVPAEELRERERIETTSRVLGLSREANDSAVLLDEIRDCETADQVGMIRQEWNRLARDIHHLQNSPDMYMECFRRTASLLLRPNAIGVIEPSELGLTRRAVADFLFHYKMSQQYPHEFTPYDLTQSADAFNAALNPLIEAFNRDLTAYQSYLRENLRTSLTAKRIATAGSFLNDGIVSVRTVSGHSASVNTTSQSYLDSSSAPDLNTLATAVTGALGGSSVSGGAAKAASAAATGGLSAEAQAALAALSTYQTTKVNVGRSLNLQVTPRSTVGASGAEMDVQLTASESADPQYWSGGNQNKSDPDISRVATHDVKTHVRVDSILLFDLSSFSAVLSKGRARLPLLPPFIELPYIGTLAGVPLPAAKEYHSSSAIVSAVVVPTAADLAFGIRYISDTVLDSAGTDCSWVSSRDQSQRYATHYCAARKALSLRDLADQPIREFHRRMLQCFATDQASSIPYADASAAKCDGLQFSEVEHSTP